MGKTTGSLAYLVLGVWAFGCGSSAAPKKGLVGTPSAGGSGAFGVVTVAGHQKMYLPQPNVSPATGNAIIAVVDVGLAGNGVHGAPALVKNIDLGTPDVATATGGDDTIVLAVSTLNTRVYFINPSTDQVVKSINLDSSYGVSNFSGGGGYVTGVAVDSPNQRAYLSVWNGFAVVDLSSQEIVSQIQVPPSENFGFDSVNQRLLAPFYDCPGLALCDTYADAAGASMTDGLNVIDLADNDTVYTYQDAQALDPSVPVGAEPDSAAADPSTGKIVVPSEGDELAYVIDLSRATFDKAHKAVSAPHVTIDVSNADELTGVAIEPGSHVAFLESESGGDMGASDLTKDTSAASTYVHASLPALPDGSTWTNLFDPHGIAVTTALSGGHPVGFLVNDSYTWVARVDLSTYLSLPATTVNGHPEVADASSAVTFLDATSSP